MAQGNLSLKMKMDLWRQNHIGPNDDIWASNFTRWNPVAMLIQGRNLMETTWIANHWGWVRFVDLEHTSQTNTFCSLTVILLFRSQFDLYLYSLILTWIWFEYIRTMTKTRASHDCIRLSSVQYQENKRPHFNLQGWRNWLGIGRFLAQMLEVVHLNLTNYQQNVLG